VTGLKVNGVRPVSHAIGPPVAVTRVAIGIAAAAFAAGILWAETGALVLGAVFLAEELYETGVLAVIVRFGEGAAAHRPPGAFPVTSPASQPPPRAR